MKKSIELTRRKFLTAAAAGAAGPAWPRIATSVVAADEKAQWCIGCRDVFLKYVDKADCWAALKALGADCFEAQVNDELALDSFSAPGRQYTVATTEGISILKADLAENRRRIAAFCMHNKFEQRMDKEIEMAQQLVQAADRLGVPAIRIDVAPRAMPIPEFLQFAIKACRRLCDDTKGLSVRFGIENHGRFTNDPDQMEKLIAGVGSDRLGITLDTANLYWWGHPLDTVYGIYERFAPRVVHTHCKSIRYPDDKKNIKREMGWEYSKYSCPIYEGDLDFNRIASILRKAGYRGALCVEDEALGRFAEAERSECLRKEITFLRKLV